MVKQQPVTRKGRVSQIFSTADGKSKKENGETLNK
jgi:hypothetical protein